MVYPGPVSRLIGTCRKSDITPQQSGKRNPRSMKEKPDVNTRDLTPVLTRAFGFGAPK